MLAWEFPSSSTSLMLIIYRCSKQDFSGSRLKPRAHYTKERLVDDRYDPREKARQWGLHLATRERLEEYSNTSYGKAISRYIVCYKLLTRSIVVAWLLSHNFEERTGGASYIYMMSTPRIWLTLQTPLNTRIKVSSDKEQKKPQSSD